MRPLLAALLLAALLVAAGCTPTEGDDGSFVPIETTNTDFNSPQFIPVGNQPITMAVGDFGGTGDTDIAVVNFLELNAASLPPEQKVSGSLSLLINDGLSPPGFTETVIGLGINASIIVAGDLDGGFTPEDDIAILVNDTDLPRVWICTDTAAFCAGATEIPLPGVAALMVRADLDGSGIADLVFTIPSTLEVVSILDLTGTALATPVTNTPGRFAIGNFDGAGFDDIAVVESGSDVIEILTGNGDGFFTSATSLAVTANPFAIISAELVVDASYDDLAVTSDINNRVTVFTSTGAAAFSTLEFDVGEDPRWLLADDFTGAAGLDLFVIHENERFITFMNSPSFSIGQQTVTRDPFDMEAADFTVDGNLDLVVVERDKRAVSVLAGTGGGGFSRTQIGFSTTVTFPIAADIDTGILSPRIDLLLLQPFSDRVVLLTNVNP